MHESDRISQTIVDFVKGGDNSDVDLLHKVFTKILVTSHGFMGTVGVTIINKQEYLEEISTGLQQYLADYSGK